MPNNVDSVIANEVPVRRHEVLVYSFNLEPATKRLVINVIITYHAT